IQVMQAMTHGDFSQRINLELPGEYTYLKQYLNDSLDRLEHSIETKNSILDNYSQGDFSFTTQVEFNGKLNELKNNMDRMAGSISNMLQTVKRASIDAVSGVEEISAGNQDLNLRVQNQATALQSTAQSMEQMAQSVAQSLQQADEVNKVSHGVQKTIQQGSEVVGEMDQAMQAIFDASSEISNITGVIDSIAFQTNLLALNAAVEAARAGEAGRGFAVVAGEVRSLAQKSAEAAKQIRHVSESSMNKIEAGLKLSQLTTQTFEENLKAVAEVSGMVEEMNQSLQKQSHGIQEVSHALNEIDNATQQNAALVEQIASTSSNIIDQVKGLETTVNAFKVLEGESNILPIKAA
ncbi:methyl-accepting chemotaxis protein, partial [Thiomicrorhabdus sp.]|uniref:methyl-accepting chemotaxis protein n=1 Tax=Thiomicrorhabdus sp. TaxID=2039724 RepID=UPI0035624480